MRSVSKKILPTLLIVLLFILTRYYIWVNKPLEFTQIIYVYMPYAHLWAQGYTPYFHQWYEYPPLTIPLFYVPHLIDVATQHWPIHFNYGDTYRASILLVDCCIFYLIAKTLKKFKTTKTVTVISLVYYSLVTAKANHFIYDSFDLVFVLGILLGLVSALHWHRLGNFLGWLGFMFATGIKYVNAPLLLPELAIKKNWSLKTLSYILVSAFLVWGIPLAIFRSSLLVTFEYHKQRGLHIESAPATIVRTINQFTQSESVAEVAKAYDIVGPVSTTVHAIFKIIFPLSLIAYILLATLYIYRLQPTNPTQHLLWITLGYISLFMVTSPVLSTPYLLWHIPFVAVLPALSKTKKVILMLISTIIISAGMTPISNLPVGPLNLHILIGWVKIIGFILIFALVIKHLLKYAHASTSTN